MPLDDAAYRLAVRVFGLIREEGFRANRRALLREAPEHRQTVRRRAYWAILALVFVFELWALARWSFFLRGGVTDIGVVMQFKLSDPDGRLIDSDLTLVALD